ncbi:MAG: hypothetical protein NT135_01855 [Candidatus Berkelbacteria bacterium]|nr:hypothetical protein [Candidatus Berkelbacteria bacterium]
MKQVDIPNIPTAEYWRKLVSRGKYPLIFSDELNEGLSNTHNVTGFDTKLTDYCRVGGSSYINEMQAKKFTKKYKKF